MVRTAMHKVREIEQDEASWKNREKHVGEAVRGHGHDNSLMPRPRLISHQGPSELLQAMEGGKVELSLPTQEAVSDWVIRRWTRRSLVLAPSVSSLAHATSHQTNEASFVGPESSSDSCDYVDNQREGHEEIDTASNVIDVPVLYHQVSQDISEVDGYPINKYRSGHGRRELTGDPKQSASAQEKWQQCPSRQREQLDVFHSHHRGDYEEDVERHKYPVIHQCEDEEVGHEGQHSTKNERIPNRQHHQKRCDDADCTPASWFCEVSQEGLDLAHEKQNTESKFVSRDSSVSHSSVSSSIKRKRSGRANVTPKPSTVLTSFKDIIGHQAVKLRMEEVLLPLALPAALSKSILKGIRAYSPSLLLYGPPGCGKTQLAKALAGEAQAAFLPIGPSDILSKFVGESEASIRSLFVKAISMAQEMESRCAVVFFDEIDALGMSRESGSSPGGSLSPGPSCGSDHGGGAGGMDTCSRRVLAELLIQLTRVNDLNGNLTMDEIGEHIDETDVMSDTEIDHGDVSKLYYSKHPFAAPREEDGVSPFDGIDDENGATGDNCSKATGGDEIKCSEPRDTIECNVETFGEAELGEGKQEVRIIVVAATNRPEDCDNALIRRFSVRAKVGLPVERDRMRIVKRFLEGIEHTLSKADFRSLASATDEWSGSDLESLTRDAVMAPVRECIRSAALLKRRTPELRRQRGPELSLRPGQASRYCVDDGGNSWWINRSPKSQRLLQEFQNLRPVTFQDFMDALAIWMSHRNFGPGSPETKLSFRQNQHKQSNVHYDSSSDEDQPTTDSP